MAEPLWRTAEHIRIGMCLYTADNPWKLTATVAIPRALLQILFFTLIGQVTGGSTGKRYALVGAIAIAIASSTVLAICDIPVTEKIHGTFFRLRLAPLNILAVFGARALPYLLNALATTILGIVVVGSATGAVHDVPQLLLDLPIYVCMIVTSAGAGLAAASLAVGKRADVLVGNGFLHLLLAASGAIIPPGRLPWLDAIGTALPLRHGIEAIHSLDSHRSAAGQVALEILVGIGWILIAVVAYSRQVRRAARDGSDDFA